MGWSDADVAAHFASHGWTPPGQGEASPAWLAERAFLALVRRLARDQGYLVYHTHRSDKSEPGFPDLVCVKPGRLIFAELKSQRGKLTTEQQTWLSLLARSIPGVEVHTWRPDDLPTIVAILGRKEHTSCQ
jgi:hypothetical protein